MRKNKFYIHCMYIIIVRCMTTHLSIQNKGELQSWWKMSTSAKVKQTHVMMWESKNVKNKKKKNHSKFIDRQETFKKTIKRKNEIEKLWFLLSYVPWKAMILSGSHGNKEWQQERMSSGAHPRGTNGAEPWEVGRGGTTAKARGFFIPTLNESYHVPSLVPSPASLIKQEKLNLSLQYSNMHSDGKDAQGMTNFTPRR